MIRATTPTHHFELPLGREMIKKILVTYAQDDVIILEKDENSVVFNDNTVEVTLTQEETLKFDANKSVQIQIRVLTPDGKAPASPIYIVPCGKVLNSEVLA